MKVTHLALQSRAHGQSLTEGVCVCVCVSTRAWESGPGMRGGRSAQTNSDVHLLVGSPNLRLGRSRLVGRGAMRDSMEQQ